MSALRRRGIGALAVGAVVLGLLSGGIAPALADDPVPDPGATATTGADPQPAASPTTDPALTPAPTATAAPVTASPTTAPPAPPSSLPSTAPVIVPPAPSPSATSEPSTTPSPTPTAPRPNPTPKPTPTPTPAPKPAVVPVTGAMATTWATLGGAKGVLGAPRAAAVRTAGLTRQEFTGGLVVAIGTGRAFAVLSRHGHTGPSWFARGGDRVLGYPLTNESCGEPGGGCVQQFQRGRIVWSAATGARAVKGAIGGLYVSAGGPRSTLRYPTGEETCGQVRRGCFQQFQGGRVLWSPSTPARIVLGSIGTTFLRLGGPASWLGYPVTNEACAGVSCIQRFTGGYLSWTVAGGTVTHRLSECQNLNDGRSRYSAAGAQRVLLAFTAAYRQSHATAVYCTRIVGVYVQDWRTDAYVGTAGFKAPGVPSGPTRHEFSPTGSYTVTEAFGLGNPGTKLSYRLLNPRSRWGGNPGTPTYNRYHESSSWVGWDENMWYFATRPGHDYRQGVVINYNRPSIVQDAGFAIFLHENKVPTAGCISLDDWAVVDYIRKSSPGDRIIMGVQSALFR